MLLATQWSMLMIEITAIVSSEFTLGVLVQLLELHKVFPIVFYFTTILRERLKLWVDKTPVDILLTNLLKTIYNIIIVSKDRAVFLNITIEQGLIADVCHLLDNTDHIQYFLLEGIILLHLSVAWEIKSIVYFNMFKDFISRV